MRLWIFVAIAFIACLAASVMTSLVIRSNTYVQELPMYLRVGDHFALNADTDALYFGTLVPASSGQRTFLVRNQRNTPMDVSISAAGAMSSWVSFYPVSFHLDGSGQQTVQASADIPAGTLVGSYNGTVKVEFRKRLFG